MPSAVITGKTGFGQSWRFAFFELIGDEHDVVISDAIFLDDLHELVRIKDLDIPVAGLF